MAAFRDRKKKPTTWRCVVVPPWPMPVYRCVHHHRSRRMALKCGRQRANAVRDYVTTEKW